MEDLEQYKGKNWMAAMAWCWAFGCFGAHRFYTGKTETAIVMLILTLTCCLAPISFIWALTDGFCLALNRYKHVDGSELFEYNKGVGIGYMVYAAFIISYILFVMLCLVCAILLPILMIIGGAAAN